MSMEVPERYNVSTLVDDNLESGHGDNVAIRCEDQQVTYADLHERMCRAGHALRTLGVQREQRVILAMDDSPAWPTVFLAAIRIGAVPVPVSYLDTTQDFTHFVSDSGATLVIAEASSLDRMVPALAPLERPPDLLSVNGSGDGIQDFDAVMTGESPELSPADTHRDDVAFWLFSGGSTGGSRRGSSTSSTTSRARSRDSGGTSCTSRSRTSLSRRRSCITRTGWATA